MAKNTADWRNLSLFFGLIGSVLGVNWAIKKVGSARVTNKRVKALKELEKNE
jgi:galactokinase/mevalonate kinase-like predicted kinase